MTNPRPVFRVAVTALAVVLATTASPAQATPSRRTITLSGSRTASLTVTFRNAVTLYDGDPAEGELGPTIEGSADVAGYVLMDARRTRVIAGVVTTDHLQPDDRPAWLPVNKRSTRVPAGRYVLTLVASAQTEVRVPVDGLASSVTYRPMTPVPLTVIDRPLDPMVGTDASGSAPIKVTTRTVTVLGVAFTTTAQEASGKFCMTLPGKGCPGLAGSAFTYATSGAVPQPLTDLSLAVLVRPDELRSGSFDAAWSLSFEGLYTTARGVAVTIG